MRSVRERKRSILRNCALFYTPYITSEPCSTDNIISHLRTPLSQALRELPAVKWWLAGVSEGSGWSQVDYHQLQTVRWKWKHLIGKTWVCSKEPHLSLLIHVSPIPLELLFVCIVAGLWFITGKWSLLDKLNLLTQSKRLTAFYFFTPCFASVTFCTLCAVSCFKSAYTHTCIAAYGKIPCLLHMATSAPSQASTFLALWLMAKKK